MTTVTRRSLVLGAMAVPFAQSALAQTATRNITRIVVPFPPGGTVEVGNLSINNFVALIAETPFGRIKESGYGREGGTEGLTHYTVVKNVSHLMM